jgi:cation:H+ antiporter
MDSSALFWLVLGLASLVAGGELLVRGAARLATLFGLSPLVIGLTVVAMGTSAPELAVSIHAGLAGQSELAIGNVVGSNIANVLLILGIAAVLVPLVVQAQIVQREVPIGIAAAVAVLILALDGRIGRVDGALLSAALIGYTAYTVAESRRETRAVRKEYAEEFGTQTRPQGAWAVSREVGIFIAGLVVLVLGAQWLVDGAVSIAESLGVSKAIIGLTIVAIGTSLPELATSVIASLRGQRDIAIGNAIGSNLFNLLAILGIAGLVTPDGLTVPAGILRFDLPVMITVAAACLPVFFVGHRLDRWEGTMFLGYYAAYLLYLTLNAVRHEALDEFSLAMVAFVMPLTAVTIAILVWRTLRARREPNARTKR